MNQNPYAAPQAPPIPSAHPAAPPMTIGRLLFSFQGRINRAKYWGGLLGMYAVFFAVIFVVALLFQSVPEAEATSTDYSTESGIYGDVVEESGDEAPMGSLIGLGLLYIPAVWIGLAISVKRWHDVDKSGWWVLIGMIPLIGPIWTFVECGCMRGTMGPNRYGPDPLL